MIIRRLLASLCVIVLLGNCTSNTSDTFLLNPENYIDINVSISTSPIALENTIISLDLILRSVEILPCNKKYHDFFYNLNLPMIPFVDRVDAGHSSITPITRVTSTNIVILNSKANTSTIATLNIPDIKYCGAHIVFGEEKIIKQDKILKLPSIKIIKNISNTQTAIQSNFSYGRKVESKINNSNELILHFNINEIELLNETTSAYSILKSTINNATIL